MPGIYVPSLYRVFYDEDGRFSGIVPSLEGVPEKITKRVVKDLDRAPFPERPIVPSTEVVHDRIMLEVCRGCTRDAGSSGISPPVREESRKLLKQAARFMRSTGYEEYL